jgi:hypothetical protein
MHTETSTFSCLILHPLIAIAGYWISSLAFPVAESGQDQQCSQSFEISGCELVDTQDCRFRLARLSLRAREAAPVKGRPSAPNSHNPSPVNPARDQSRSRHPSPRYPARNISPPAFRRPSGGVNRSWTPPCELFLNTGCLFT